MKTLPELKSTLTNSVDSQKNQNSSKGISKKIFVTMTCLMVLVITLGSISSRPNQFVKATPDENMAICQTDRYVWEKMVRAFQVKTTDPLNLEWELWSTSKNAYKYNCGDTANVWPVAPIDGFKYPKAVSFSNFSGSLGVTAFADLTLNATNPYYEELRLNKAMFDYIQDAGLYDQNTVYELAKEGKINFPKEAMMIKAQWIPVSDEEAKYYYTKPASLLKKDIVPPSEASLSEAIKAVEDASEYHIDTLVGLVGWHLVTHELPNWVWSTFEYRGNPGLCDHIGCKDAFGCDPPFIAPNEKLNQGYGKDEKWGKTSQELKDLFREFDIPDVFENYRLKGTQTEYTRPNGDAIILGNSILEMNLVPTSSCISCHARATLNNATPARGNLPMFKSIPGSQFVTEDEVSDTTTLGGHPICFTGKPIVKSYLGMKPDSNCIHPDDIFYPTDFLWQLAQHAKPCDKD